MITFPLLQYEQKEWSDKNFGKDQPSHQPLLGIIEEVGELNMALATSNVPEIKDAIADAIIFASGYCSSRGWSLQMVANTKLESLPGDPGMSPIVNVMMALQQMTGVLAHHHLKHEQGIRESSITHEVKAKNAMTHILILLASMATLTGNEVFQILDEVWSTVKLRDWSKATGVVNGKV